jgi:hypothetical protein
LGGQDYRLFLLVTLWLLVGVVVLVEMVVAQTITALVALALVVLEQAQHHLTQHFHTQ